MVRFVLIINILCTCRGYKAYVYEVYKLEVFIPIDLVSEYQQYQEATADDDEDEDGYDNGYDDEVQDDE